MIALILACYPGDTNTTNRSEAPPVWNYSPKQGDFHPINAEAIAYRSATEVVVGLRSPLTNRTTGDAYAFVFDDASVFLSAANWQAGPADGFGQTVTLDLGGRGIRSIEWCSQLAGGTGEYLIVAGPSNGGPLKNETGREPFALYRWAGPGSEPILAVADLSSFAVRPEGVCVMTLGGVPRVLFVEDRFLGSGYDTRNAVHWPLADLNLQ